MKVRLEVTFALHTTVKWSIIEKLKQATFLSHRRKPEIDISHVKTVVSLRFSKKSSLLVKRYLAI